MGTEECRPQCLRDAGAAAFEHPGEVEQCLATWVLRPRSLRQPCRRPPCCVSLGAAGVETVYGLGELNTYEAAALKAMMPELRASIEKGVKFAQES